jgi:hypothetical protein
MLLDKGVDIPQAVEQRQLGTVVGDHHNHMLKEPVTASNVAQKNKLLEIEEMILAKIRTHSLEVKPSQRSFPNPAAHASFQFRFNPVRTNSLEFKAPDPLKNTASRYMRPILDVARFSY